MTRLSPRNSSFWLSGFGCLLAVAGHWNHSWAQETQTSPAEPSTQAKETQAAESDAQPSAKPPEKDALPGLTQPGDDASPELKPKTDIDPKQTEAQAAYMEGLAAQKDGRLNDALKAFRRAAEADPKAADPLRAEAILLRRLGRIRQAEQRAREAIEVDPEDYQMRLELAGLLLAGQKGGEAAQLIDEALESKKLDHASPDFINLHSIRGRIHLLGRDAAGAADSYSVILKALEKPEDFGLDFRQHQTLMADRTTGYETVGKIMLEVGRYDKAIVAFSAMARINEDEPGDYHYWLAQAQYRKDDIEPALKNLNRYFETKRRSHDSLQLLRDLLRVSDRSDDLVPQLVELEKNSIDTDAVNMFLGELYIDRGEGAKASEVFKSVIANSGTADAYLGLVRVDILNRDAAGMLNSINKALNARITEEELVPLTTYLQNDEAFAKSVVEEAVRSLKDSSAEQQAGALYFYSQLADKLEMHEQEGQLLQATLDRNPPPALGIEALGRLGLNLYAQEKYAESAEVFRRLLSIPGLPAGEQVMSLYRLSAVEAENENFDGALKAIDMAMKIAPSNPQLTYQQGLIQFQADKLEDAEKTLKSAVSLSAGDAALETQSLMLLGALYDQMSRWDDAIREYNKLLEKEDLEERSVRRARMRLSNAYVQKGDMAGGEKILEEVYKSDPTDPGVNNDLGYLYAEQNKNLEQAEKMIRIAVDAEPDNPAYLDSLGWVLYRLGKHEEALETLRKANADPDYRDATIIEHLGDVQKALKQDSDASKTWQEALEVERKSAAPDEAIVKRLEGKIGPNGQSPGEPEK
ncbi:MAG: tetratricopeptide repeat protein [Planctomycetaceae bacterium]